MRQKQRPPDSFRFPKGVRERIDRLAAEKGIPKNVVVVQMLEFCLSNSQFQIKNPSEAINSWRSASEGFAQTNPKEAAGYGKQ